MKERKNQQSISQDIRSIISLLKTGFLMKNATFLPSHPRHVVRETKKASNEENRKKPSTEKRTTSYYLANIL